MFGGVAKSLYLCTVFFMVLDLRLTKIGTRRSPFFILWPFSPSFTANNGIRKMYSFCALAMMRTPFSEKIYLPCQRRYTYFAREDILTLPEKYIFFEKSVCGSNRGVAPNAYLAYRITMFESSIITICLWNITRYTPSTSQDSPPVLMMQPLTVIGNL